MADVIELPFRQLPPEPWGARFARARKEAGYTLREAASVFHVGYAGLNRQTIHNLEQRESAPTSDRDRYRAYLLLVMYRFDPLEFGLSPDDVPPYIDLRELFYIGEHGIPTTEDPLYLDPELGSRTGSFWEALADQGLRRAS